jgi:hypothetical protein
MSVPRYLACAALLAVASCSSKSDDGGKSNDKPAATRDAAAKAPAADAGAPAGVDAGFAKLPADSFAPIGVAECDAYIKKQRECVEEHAPEGIRDQQLDGLGHIANRWRQVAAAGGTEQLIASCKSLGQASAEATAAWTCKW